MDTQNRDFKGIWICKEIWLDKRLSALDKFILAEVDSLDGENGCFASNEYIAEFCQCSATKVSLSISKLIKLGYLEQSSFDGRHRVLKSRLSKSERQSDTLCEAETKKVNAIISNREDKSISIKKESKKKKQFVPPTYEEVQAYAEQRGKGYLVAEFYEYWTNLNWVDKQGKPVKSWEGRFATWVRNNDTFNGNGSSRASKPVVDGRKYNIV